MRAATYYSSIIAWSVFYIGASFKTTFPWSVSDCAPGAATCAVNDALPYNAAEAYFRGVVTRQDIAALRDGTSDVVFDTPHRQCVPLHWC